MKNILTQFHVLGRYRFALLLIISQCAFGQTGDTNGFDVNRNRGLEAEDQNLIDSAITLYRKAETIAIAENNKSKEATILNDLGIASRKKGDYVGCKNYHQKAQEVALKAKDFEMVEMSFHGLGTLYEQTGDYDDAVACYLKTLKLTGERGDQEGIIITRQNLAKTYMHLHFQDAAMKNIEAALQSSYLLKNDSLSANVLHDYAEILIHFKEYAIALTKMETALQTYQKIGYDRYIGSSLVYLGDIYAKIDQPEHSFSYFERALVYADKVDKDVLADLYLKIGSYYEKKGNLPMAKVYFIKSNDLAKQDSYRAIEQTASWKLYELYRTENQPHEALAYLENSSSIKDDLYNIEKTGRVAELQLRYDNEKQLRRVHAMELKQNRYILLGCVLLFLTVISALVYHSRTKSKNNKILAIKNAEIAEQNKQLADHINVLKQYSYAAAHDLKEPLRTITSFIGLLERRFIKNIAEPEAQEYMQFISNSALRMNLLLTDLLEYNSILSQEAGTESIQPIEIIHEVWGNLSALAEDKGAKLYLPEHIPNIKINRFHFMQLIQNLVSNGIKFTEGKDAKIKIGFEQKDASFTLSINDNGIGISDQYREKIFQMFYRLNDLKEAEGTGIGLTIVKNITEKYKGRIWFKSEPNSGTTFYLSFPNTMLEVVKEVQKTEFSRSAVAATL